MPAPTSKAQARLDLRFRSEACLAATDPSERLAARTVVRRRSPRETETFGKRPAGRLRSTRPLHTIAALTGPPVASRPAAR